MARGIAGINTTTTTAAQLLLSTTTTTTTSTFPLPTSGELLITKGGAFVNQRVVWENEFGTEIFG